MASAKGDGVATLLPHTKVVAFAPYSPILPLQQANVEVVVAHDDVELQHEVSSLSRELVLRDVASFASTDHSTAGRATKLA